MEISSPDYHLGHTVIASLSERPDVVCQIDAATGEQETRRSVLSRSIRLARALNQFGLKTGDVLALAGINHLDVVIPYNAGLMNGYPIAGVEPYFKFDEIKSILKIIKPKVAFCEHESYEDYKRAAKELGLDMNIVTFKKGQYTMEEFIADYHDNQPEELFKVAAFDPVKTYGWLVSTSGTTGKMKVAAIPHNSLKFKLPWFLNQKTEALKPVLSLCGIQGISALANIAAMPFANFIKIQTSAPCTTEHAIDIINKYKPVSVITTTPLLSRIIKSEKKCDLTSFDSIILTGSKVTEDLLNKLRSLTKHPNVAKESYGHTETVGPVLQMAPQGPIGNCGKPMPIHPVKLVDPVTGEVITEPNKHGELWISGGLFTEYYNDPEETKQVFSEDGWYKSGDLMYRDENDYYYFVERTKILIKYRHFQVFPGEIEELILTHKDVVEVCVTSVIHPDDGERAVACVKRRPGSSVTEQEIKELVASKLSESKQLYGGVIFVDHIPMTSNGKVARGKVRELVMQKYKEE